MAADDEFQKEWRKVSERGLDNLLAKSSSLLRSPEKRRRVLQQLDSWMQALPNQPELVQPAKTTAPPRLRRSRHQPHPSHPPGPATSTDDMIEIIRSFFEQHESPRELWIKIDANGSTSIDGLIEGLIEIGIPESAARSPQLRNVLNSYRWANPNRIEYREFARFLELMETS